MPITLRDKYQHDPHFKSLVDIMVSNIQAFHFTPSEMREAAMLASIIYEEHNISRMKFVEPDIEAALRVIRKRLEKE